MSVSLSEITAAIFMVGVASALFVAIRTHRSAASERRMISMLESVGLDPAIASSDQSETVLDCMSAAAMKNVRQRCRTCTTEDLCERWLAGEEDGDNDFCPNAKVFDALKMICAAVAQRRNHSI